MPLLVDVIQVQMDLEINRAYMRQLASAVAYLHERGVTHNDIKPANIMISHSGCPVLIDFGFAHVFDLSHRDAFWTQTSWGTPEVSWFVLLICTDVS
jgi:serine/threonine protein kinase